MNQTRVKICGLTRVEDVNIAVAAGADAIGFVFTASPRRVTVSQAMELLKEVPDQLQTVGLFLDQRMDEVEQVINALPLDLLQFHGRESEAFCKSFGKPYLKAVAMQDVNSAKDAEQAYPSASGLLLDSHKAGKAGGSGKVFDWALARPVAKPVWLAGGLNADNVGRAIELVKPWAVDVSSGVESSPGIKDANRIKAFIRAVKRQ